MDSGNRHGIKIMKPYLIHFWHGRPEPESHFAKKVDAVCRKRPEDGVYFWDGTLEEFAEKFCDKFIYIPSQEMVPPPDPNKGIICITQHGSFSQR